MISAEYRPLRDRPVRWRVGADHRHVVPLSAALGAVVLLVVDTGTRAAPMPLPPGVITSLLGAPMFLVILLRHERRNDA